MKDVDRVVIPQDPLLDLEIQRPLMERADCGGAWKEYDQHKSEISFYDIIERDCFGEPYPEYGWLRMNSKDSIRERQKNIFKVALFYNPSDFIITKVTLGHIPTVNFEFLHRSPNQPG